VAPFLPFFEKYAKSSASEFPGPTQFFSAPLVFCGRNFGPLTKLKKRNGVFANPDQDPVVTA
jgi:hypothetical protein